MGRRLAAVTLDNLDDVPGRCRHCVFWELDAVGALRAEEAGDPGLEKEAWVSDVLLEWGSCGVLVYADGAPAGVLWYAPPAYVPRAPAFPTSPVSADAVLLTTAHVVPELARHGLGRMLVQGMARDLVRRGVRAVEAFGDARGNGEVGHSVAAAEACVLPVDFLLAVGFTVVRPHPTYPRVRLDLRSTVSWREDMEVAIERLLGSFPQSEKLLRPV